jgi:hypothetical protein
VYTVMQRLQEISLSKSESPTPSLSAPSPRARGESCGAAATLMMRYESQPTLLEFKPKPTLSHIHQQANLLAMTLIRLWTPVCVSETSNFIPHYQFTSAHTPTLTEIALPKNTRPFHQCSTEQMNRYFLNAQAQNLGALTLLNLLMGSEMSSDSLGIVESPTTHELFFSQRLSIFWIDFFLQKGELDWFSTHNMETKLQGFQSDGRHSSWWNTVFYSKENGVIHKSLYFNECIDTAFQILLTPPALINKIISDIFGEHPLTDLFSTYLLNRLEQFKQEFASVFVDDSLDWPEYVGEYGADYLKSYIAHLKTFQYDGWDKGHRCTINLSSDVILESVLLQGMSASIFDLTSILLENNLLSQYKLQDQITCFDYAITEAKRVWPSMARDPNHVLWELFQQISKDMGPLLSQQKHTIKVSTEKFLFLTACLMKSIQFQQNDVSEFLIRWILKLALQKLSSSPYMLEDDLIWMNHSLLYLAIQLQNEDIITLLQQRGAILLENERVDAPTATSSPVREQKTTMNSRARRMSFFDHPFKQPTGSEPSNTYPPGASNGSLDHGGH